MCVGFRPSGASVAVFVQEKLQGVDVLTYLSSRHEYSEQTVANIITQVRVCLIIDSVHFYGNFF